MCSANYVESTACSSFVYKNLQRTIVNEAWWFHKRGLKGCNVATIQKLKTISKNFQKLSQKCFKDDEN